MSKSSSIDFGSTTNRMRRRLERIFPKRHLTTLDEKLNNFGAFTKPQDLTDLAQEGLVTLCECINLETVETDCNNSTQAQIENKLESFRRSNRHHKHLVKQIKKLEHEWFQPATDVAEIEEVRHSVRKALINLTPGQNHVIKKLYGIGCTPESISEIAECQGVCHENIRKIRDRALSKMSKNTTLQSLVS